MKHQQRWLKQLTQTSSYLLEATPLPARVIGRARDECGELIGRSNSNPMVDTSVYEVKLTEDGTTLSYVQETVGHRTDIDPLIDRYSSTKN